MKDLRINRRQVLKGLGAVGVLGALGTPATVFADDEGTGTKVRWDIIVASSPDTVAGGTAAALARNGFQITMTGSGTFGPEGSADVTGGGNWTTFDPKGATTGTGTYEVTRVVQSSAVLISSVAPSGIDFIGNPADARGGVAVLRIAYSDGTQGVLTVSCRRGAGTAQPAVFEGITATKDVVGYVNQGTDGPLGFTLFHVLPPGE